VIRVSKRRQRTSRPETKAEVCKPRNPVFGKADALVRAESTIVRIVKRQDTYGFPGVVEPSMLDIVMMYQLGRTYLLSRNGEGPIKQ